MNIGLRKADAEGVEVFLSASPMGVPVYEKLGFKEVGRLEIALGAFEDGDLGEKGVVHVHGEFLLFLIWGGEGG